MDHSGKCEKGPPSFQKSREAHVSKNQEMPELQAACLVEAAGQDFLHDGAAEAPLVELEMPRSLESSG